ncbi:MAG TPA: pyridoxal phosphate-dependent aminotransferase [Candidatus Omnitrophota bacterium]|nr:pyridoxal phosphate-dependent aminotransferase [Candidatus Omnitrophota bacterium]
MPVSFRAKNTVGSTTLAITARAKELKAQGHDVVSFAAGEPDFDTPDFIKKAAIDAIQNGLTKYTPSSGTIELRQAIANKFQRDNQLSYNPKDQIVVSCGAKHSLYTLMQALVDAGDEVLIPAPFWVSYPEMVKLAGATPKILETCEKTKFKITARQLEENISPSTKVLIINSPSNPTGTVYTRKELESIAAVCVKRNIVVVSDEIYEKLCYANEPFVSIGSLGKDIYNLTVTVNGVSKAYAMTGWRIGYLGASKEIAQSVAKIQDHSTSNPTSISQAAALAALNADESTLNAMKEEFRKRRDFIVKCLDQIPQIDYIYPEGAFYVFCNISKTGLDSDTIAKKVLDEKDVACIPGSSFGADDYIRLGFATSMERIEEGTRRLAEWFQNNQRG